MALGHLFDRISKARWVRTAGAGLAALVLIPVAASAFSIGLWQFQTRAHNAPSASAQNTGTGTFTADFGTFTSHSGFASSKLVATNTFTVAPGGETVNVANSFASLLNSANAKVHIEVFNSRGLEVINEKSFRFGPDGNFFSVMQNSDNFLSAGTYRVVVIIKYSAFGRNHGWTNVSPHTVSITAV